MEGTHDTRDAFGISSMKRFIPVRQDGLFKVWICRAVFRRAGQGPYRRLAGLAATFH
jgi:hypothetical protein